MDDFIIEIAGLNVRVQPLFGSTREYCRAYLTDNQPEFLVDVSKDDLVREQALWEKEALEEGLRIRKFSDPFLERATIQRKIAVELINRDTILLHGSTVGVDGSAYLFTAPCGTGKSTHTRFWREVFGERAVMVNDDKAFLRVTAEGVFAYGSPWSGKHGLDSNVCLPLKGICFLQRGSDNRIQRGAARAYFGELCHQTLMPEDISRQRKAIDLIAALVQQVPLWEMECIKDPSAAFVSFHAMSGGQ